MTNRFDGKTVVITGGGGGLGQTSAIRFAREGATLVLLDINAQGLQESAQLVEQAGAACSTYAFDIADETEVNRVGAEICAAHPRIDVLYNNAGIAYGEITGFIDTFDQATWLRYLSINTLSPLMMAKALRPSLAAAHGVILNQSSMAANAPSTAYGLTKAALNSMTYGMANVFSADNIRVNAIAPGLMETPANKAGLSAETYARVQSMQLSNLHGTAEDIASLALFLASDEGRFINCEVVACDAGNRLRGWRY